MFFSFKLSFVVYQIMHLLVQSYLAKCNGKFDVFLLEIAAKKAHDQKFGSLCECFNSNKLLTTNNSQ